MAARKGMPRLIRKICLWCQGDSLKLVQECNQDDCPLHPCRLLDDGDNRVLGRCLGEYCLWCAGSVESVAACTAHTSFGVHGPCPAYPYRIPHNVAAAPLVRSTMRTLPGLRISPAGSPSGPGDGSEREVHPCVAVRPPSQTGSYGSLTVECTPEALDI